MTLPALVLLLAIALLACLLLSCADKGVGRPVRGRFRNHVEYICWGSNGLISDVQDVYPSSVFRVTPPTYTSRQHRTEKPAELLQQLMQIIRPDSYVLDPFMGSGTTGVACVKTGRRFIGIEISKEYFTIARKRIEKAMEDTAMPLLEGVA